MYTCTGYLSTFFRYCKCNGLVYMVFLLPDKSALCVALCSLCVISWSMYDIWTDGFSTISVGYWCSFTLALGNSRPAFHLLSVCTLVALYRQWLNITAKIRIFPGFQNVHQNTVHFLCLFFLTLFNLFWISYPLTRTYRCDLPQSLFS